MLGSPHISGGQTIWAIGQVRCLRPQIVALSISPRLYNNARPPHWLSDKSNCFSTVGDTGISFKAAVMNDPEFGSLLGREEMTRLDQPERYLGHAVQIVEQAIEDIERKRELDPETLGETDGQL